MEEGPAGVRPHSDLSGCLAGAPINRDGPHLKDALLTSR